MQGVQNIALCGKPHIVNYPIHRETFDERGFGIVSCYNALPLGAVPTPWCASPSRGWPSRAPTLRSS